MRKGTCVETTEPRGLETSVSFLKLRTCVETTVSGFTRVCPLMRACVCVKRVCVLCVCVLCEVCVCVCVCVCVTLVVKKEKETYIQASYS